MPVGAGAGAASGQAWGWLWRPDNYREARAHGPALGTDLHGLHRKGVEDDLDARADQGGVDLIGVAVQGDGGRLGHRAGLGPQERFVQRRRAGQHRRAAGEQAVDGGFARFRMRPAVVDGLDPGAEQPVELGQVRRGPGFLGGTLVVVCRHWPGSFAEHSVELPDTLRSPYHPGARQGVACQAHA